MVRLAITMDDEVPRAPRPRLAAAVYSPPFATHPGISTPWAPQGRGRAQRCYFPNTYLIGRGRIFRREPPFAPEVLVGRGRAQRWDHPDIYIVGRGRGRMGEIDLELVRPRGRGRARGLDYERRYMLEQEGARWRGTAAPPAVHALPLAAPYPGMNTPPQLRYGRGRGYANNYMFHQLWTRGIAQLPGTENPSRISSWR